MWQIFAFDHVTNYICRWKLADANYQIVLMCHKRNVLTTAAIKTTCTLYGKLHTTVERARKVLLLKNGKFGQNHESEGHGI